MNNVNFVVRKNETKYFGFFSSSMPCFTGNCNSKIKPEIRLKILTWRSFEVCSQVEFEFVSRPPVANNRFSIAVQATAR